MRISKWSVHIGKVLSVTIHQEDNHEMPSSPHRRLEAERTDGASVRGGAGQTAHALWTEASVDAATLEALVIGDSFSAGGPTCVPSLAHHSSRELRASKDFLHRSRNILAFHASWKATLCTALFSAPPAWLLPVAPKHCSRTWQQLQPCSCQAPDKIGNHVQR